MKNKNLEPVDIVITWVDGSDSEWLAEKAKFSNKKIDLNKHVGGKNRYQDQGLLKYWFRGIENCMPWVNHIYFVTCGHYPDWLNLDNPKLTLVKHSDFMPSEYLPTFNSNSILLNLHRIKGLSDRFIYFNDDMYVINFCKYSNFFKNGLPRDMAIMNPVVAPDTDPFWDMMVNNIMVVNKNFNKKQSIKHNRCKYYSLKYSIKNLVRNISLSSFNYFPGFYDNHLPNAYLKSTFEEVWEKNFDICNATSLNKFRNSEDITEWTMKYWQFAKGSFKPINKEKLGLFLSLKSNYALKYLKSKPTKPLVCLNDESDNMDDFIKIFEIRFPKKSSYEK